MEIITVTLAHLEAVVKIFDAYRVWYRQPTDLKGALSFLKERFQNKDSVMFAAKDSSSGEFVGFVQLYPLFSSTRMRRVWLLNDLFVKKEFRGKGISKQLIAQAKQLAKETDACGLLLETEKSNDIGNQLYPATGFELESATHYYFWTNTD